VQHLTECCVRALGCRGQSCLCRIARHQAFCYLLTDGECISRRTEGHPAALHTPAPNLRAIADYLNFSTPVDRHHAEAATHPRIG
jgi:hypothetical protein